MLHKTCSFMTFHVCVLWISSFYFWENAQSSTNLSNTAVNFNFLLCLQRWQSCQGRRVFPSAAQIKLNHWVSPLKCPKSLRVNALRNNNFFSLYFAKFICSLQWIIKYCKLFKIKSGGDICEGLKICKISKHHQVLWLCWIKRQSGNAKLYCFVVM